MLFAFVSGTKQDTRRENEEAPVRQDERFETGPVEKRRPCSRKNLS